MFRTLTKLPIPSQDKTRFPIVNFLYLLPIVLQKQDFKYEYYLEWVGLSANSTKQIQDERDNLTTLLSGEYHSINIFLHIKSGLFSKMKDVML